MPSLRVRVRRDGGQAISGRETPRALHMHGQIAVAELEPGLAAELLQRAHEGPGLVLAAPARRRIVETR